MTIPPIELVFLILAVGAMASTGFLFTLELSDLMKIKRQKTNGPVLFMKWDNIRHHGFMLAFSTGMVTLASTSVNNPASLTIQATNLLSGGVGAAVFVLLDAFFKYRRRWKLESLVAQYEGKPGGKRNYDPPLENGRG